MDKQLYLNFIFTKGIGYFGLATIVLNLIARMVSTSIDLASVMPFINLINLIAIVVTLSSILNVHWQMAKNNSHFFFYTMPNRKVSILKGDYVYNLIMLVFTAIIFITYTFINEDYFLFYSLTIFTGLALIMLSLYHYLFSITWMRGLVIKFILFFIPLVFIIMFYHMPLRNTVEMNLSLGAAWEVYLYEIPFYVLGAGVILYALSFVAARKNIVKKDIN